jgi:serine/threonine protein kinase
MRVCPKCLERYRDDEGFCAFDGSPLVEPDGVGSTPSATDPLVGALIADRYRIVQKLGEGGMGAVYRARHETLQRDVAVKFLHPLLAEQVGTVKRFLVEALASSRVDHPNIVSVFDFGRERDGRYFLVMELVAGRPLSAQLAAAGRIDQLATIHILGQVLSALVAAHGAGIVHRDLKPDNLLCTSRLGDPSFVKVLDFGLAKILGGDRPRETLTEKGFIMGTPWYMSPEQARGAPVDPRSDLYSIGVVAYEMLTGHVPFDGPPVVVVSHHVETPPRPLSEVYVGTDLHPAMEFLVLTLMQKSPDDRFQSAEAALNALVGIRQKVLESPPDREVLAETRAALRPHTVAAIGAMRSQKAAEARSAPESGGRTPEVTELQSPGTHAAWEAPGVIQEISRLGGLWNRRVAEVADLLWGAGRRPPEVQRTLDAIGALEARISDREADAALLRERVDALEKRLRAREGDLRRRRVDLVAQLRSIGEGQADPGSLPCPMETAETMLPPAADLVGAVQSGRRRSMTALDQDIESVDRALAVVHAERGEALAAPEQQLAETVAEVRRLQAALTPLHARLSAMATTAAVGRDDTLPLLTALGEVAGAIQVYQALLKTLMERS